MRKRGHAVISALLAAITALGGCVSISGGVPGEPGETLPAVNLSEQSGVTLIVPGQETTEAATSEAPADTAGDDTVTETAPPPVTEGTAAPVTVPYRERLERICDERGVYGLSAAVFRDGEIIHTENIGFMVKETETPVTDDTRFRCASVSKLVSTIVLMQLCDEGFLDTQTDLTAATGIKYQGCGSGTVRLWHLLTHTAGITDTYTYDQLAPIYKTSINDILAGAHTGNAAGSVYNYCNFGAGSIGAIVERITGTFFHDYADMSLFEPLGMDAGYLIDLIDDKQSCAYIYDYDGEIFRVPEWGRDRRYYESFGLGNSYLTAQCELLITASDLARLGTALAGDGTVKECSGIRILSEKSVEAMHKVWFEKDDDFDMGLNVRIYDGTLVKGRTICGHPGNALGAICGIYYDRSDHTGVAILTNRCDQAVSDNGVYTLLNDIVNETYSEFFG